MAKSKKSSKISSKASKKKSSSKQVSKKVSKKAKKGSKKSKKGSKKSKKVSKKAKKVSKKAKKVSKKAKKGSKKSKKSKKGLRSFKVKLPGNEAYAGRFTGLTPYQAANKALSKYFRENKNVKSKISFTIKESTRSSKRNEYTYTGKRLKLEKPIEYSIGEGKLITKRYKNKLTKVKKGMKPSV
jgi:hypothetical protein